MNDQIKIAQHTIYISQQLYILLYVANNMMGMNCFISDI